MIFARFQELYSFLIATNSILVHTTTIMHLNRLNKIEAGILLCGDVLILYGSLFVSLFLRRLELPTRAVWESHIAPFGILILVWVLSFFIAGLYEKQTRVFKQRVLETVLKTQAINSVIGVLFFYFIPFFGITPKTTLFLYIGVSFGLIVLWRRVIVSLIGVRGHDTVMVIGTGSEMYELVEELHHNSRHGLVVSVSLDIATADDATIRKTIEAHLSDVDAIIIDTNHERIVPILPYLYGELFAGVRFIAMHKVYEQLFDRIPLSLITYNWFLENISNTRKIAYEGLKRLMDICIALPLLILACLSYPLVWLAITLDDGGTVFIRQERVGKNNKLIRIIKVRSMAHNSKDEQLLKDTGNVITRVGAFLRKTRIDELPQLWNVLIGDISLIGPRPEFPALVTRYEEEVPFYTMRHLVKPGLSGWAQMYHDEHPHHGVDVNQTRVKLSYDLYYIKNRSFFLDLKIALRTIDVLLSRKGK